jgi:hypothetical protein
MGMPEQAECDESVNPSSASGSIHIAERDVAPEHGANLEQKCFKKARGCLKQVRLVDMYIPKPPFGYVNISV